MAISKAMRLALKALSYPEIDVRRSYKIERTVSGLAAPVISALYQKWDRVINSDGRQVTVRIYPSEEAQKQTGGLLLFFHGGGWVKENVDTYNSVCKALARETHYTVASVEYSLAPERRFPEGFNDCYAAAKEIILNSDYSPIVLIGDSAGGNLAAAVSIKARDTGDFKVEKQILIYPATSNDHSPASPFNSIRENGFDYLLTSKRICEYMELYMNSEDDLYSPYFAPLLTDSFEGLPKTLIITAEFDPLRDEGEEFGKKITEAGGECRIYRVADALHGFFALPMIFSQVKEAYEQINLFLENNK